MKLKLTLMAIAATFALGYQAHASIGTVTNSSKLSIAITVKTNVYSESGSTEKYTLKSAKITNKDLLKLTAAWYDVENTNEVGTTTWPDGAQLVVGWDSEWDGDVLVVDKTGTNVLYDAIGDDSTHYFLIDDFYEDGVYSENYLDADPGSYAYTEYASGEFEFYDDDFFLPYTEVEGYYIPSTVKFFENWDADGNYKTWKQSETISAFGAEEYFLDFDYATSTGTIKDSGHGNGYNGYFD